MIVGLLVAASCQLGVFSESEWPLVGVTSCKGLMMVPGVVLLNETPVGNGNRDADLLFKPDLATEQHLTMVEELKLEKL